MTRRWRRVVIVNINCKRGVYVDEKQQGGVMKAWRLAWLHLRRDAHQPALRVLLAALIIAVMAVSAVGFFTDRLNKLMQYQATELIGADLKIKSARPLPAEFVEQAARRGLRSARLLTFPSVVLYRDATLLSALKAVTAAYPLRGQLKISQTLDAPEQVTDDIPAPGTVWAETIMLQRLGAQVGDIVEVGQSQLRISAVLRYEPDRQGRFSQFAPRLMLNMADLEATGLVGAGSRVRHHLLFGGEAEAIQAFRLWLDEHRSGDQSIEDINDASPTFRAALERAQRFLSLAVLTAVLLAGAAIAIAANHFARLQADAGAILRCLGATQKMILLIYSLRLLGLGLLASIIGISLGWIAQYSLTEILRQSINLAHLPAPSWIPIWQSLAIAFITLIGFALPPLLRIHRVPPLRVLRNDLGVTPPSVWQVSLFAGGAMIALLWWQANDWKLALILLAGGAAAFAVLLGVAYGLLALVQGFVQQPASSTSSGHRFFKGGGLSLRFGLLQLVRHRHSNSLQLAAFGLSIMALLLLALVRVDLLDTWESQLNRDAPNYFALNIQPAQRAAFENYLAQQQLRSSGIYPMAVGRFSAINGKTVNPDDYDNPRAQRLLRRTFNLSAAAALPDDNTVLAGSFDANRRGEVSVEKDFADTIGIKLGDELRFDVGGQSVATTVTSLRDVQWDSFNVNFFVFATPDVLENLPLTYVSSFYQDQHDEITTMARQFPGLTLINLDSILSQVRMVMNRAALAVQYVFGFTLLAGITVLYAGLTASQAQRRRETAILRSLGASRSLIQRSLLIEFSVLGLLAGFIAASFASLIGYLLATQVFNLAYQFNPWLWLIGLIGGGIGIAVAGIMGIRGVLKQSPVVVLRQG
jgi:putative ABC transport system permease protein